jgi:hypothetical protein
MSQYSHMGHLSRGSHINIVVVGSDNLWCDGKKDLISCKRKGLYARNSRKYMRKRFYLLIFLVLFFIGMSLLFWIEMPKSLKHNPDLPYPEIVPIYSTLFCGASLALIGGIFFLYYLWGSIVIFFLKGTFNKSEDDRIRQKYTEMLQEDP